MRQAGRVDSNQAEIVEALRKAGADVIDMHRVGGGFPDLLICYGGYLTLMEVKSPTGKLNKAELRWHERHGVEMPVHIVHNIDEALRTIGVETEAD